MRGIRVGLVLTLALISLSCGGAEKVSGTQAGEVNMVLITDGGMNVSYGGQNYTASGAYSIPASSGTFEVSGTFSGSYLAIGFATVSGDVGIQPGTVKSLAGPSLGDDVCQANYQSFASGSKSVRVRFTVVKNATGICR